MSKKIKKFPNQRASSESPQLTIPLAELLQMELRAFVLTCGMIALQTLLDNERDELCGPAYERGRKSSPRRAGSTPGSLVMGGRRVRVKRPRVRDEHGEVTLPSWATFSEEDPLQARALEQMVLGVATRRYARSLEPMPETTEDYGTSRSAVSRRFKAATEKELRAYLQRDLGRLSLAAIMIDGIHIADHVVVTALGIDESGRKHVLGFWDGSTENGAVCTSLLSNLVERGLSADRSLLFVLDGSKALRKAIQEVFGDRALVQRCQLHKRKNVEDHLPKSMRTDIAHAMKEAYRSEKASTAKRRLQALANQLADSHPGASRSLKEGLDETLTVKTLKLPDALQRILSTTNVIENLNGQVRRVTRRVKRWRGGSMILRWIAAAYGEAEKGFRRIRGCKHLPSLITALRANDTRLDQEIDTLRKVA